MKKRLLICLVLILALSATVLVACNKKIDKQYLDEMYADFERAYRDFNSTVTDSFEIIGMASTFDDNNKDIEVTIQWTVGGADADKITVGKMDPDSGYCMVNVPAVRPAALSFTLTGKFVDNKGKAYLKEDGTEYSVTLTCQTTTSDALKAARNAFYDAAIKTPQAGTAYKWAAMVRYQVLYFKGETAGGTYKYKTTTNYNEATDVYLEATEGGYHVYFMNGETKTYIDIFKYGSNAGSTGFVTDIANVKGVYTVHETGALVGKDPTDTTDTSKGYNLGVREQYATEVRAINYYLDNETGTHGWKTYEHPLFLLDKAYELPAQENLTQQQIIDRAYSLVDGDEMSGCWTLQGEVIEASGDATYRSATIQVGDKTIMGYGMYTYNNEVKVGAVISITGVIKNYDGTIEFDKYCSYRLITAGPSTVVVNEINAKVVELSKTEGAVGETFTFKVELNENCTLTSVKVNGEAVQPDDNGVYTGTFAAETTVEVVAADPSAESHAGTADDPYTVAEAIALCPTKPADVVYVKGIVDGNIKLTGFDPKDKWQCDIVDAAGDSNKLTVYFAKALEEPVDGQEIVVKGWLTMYNTTPEIASKNKVDPIIVSVNGTATGLDSGDTPTPPVVDETTILGQIKAAAVSAPVTTGSYKLVLWQGTLQKALYATGAMSGSYLATSQDPSAAAAVTVEEATGGFYLALTVDGAKKYVTVTPRTSDTTKADISLADTATSVLTVNANGLLVSGDFVLGTYSTYNTISVSNISYFSDTSVIDNSQFVARIIPADTTINIPDGTIKEADSNEHVTVAITEPTPVEGVVTAKWYTTVKFTVTPDNGYAIVSVKVNGKSINAKTGNEYEVELIGNMEITVDIKDATASKDKYTITFTQAEMADHGSSTYTGSWTHTSDELEITLEAMNANKSNGGWAFVRAGRKDNTSVAKITATITEKVSSITMTVDTYTSSKGTATVYLLVSDSDDFTNAKRIELTGTFAAGEVTFNIPEAAANMHYQIVIDCASGSANGFIQISKIVYNCATTEE